MGEAADDLSMDYYSEDQEDNNKEMCSCGRVVRESELTYNTSRGRTECTQCG